MNLHEFADELTVAMSALLMGKKKYFAKDIFSAESYEYYFDNISFELPPIVGTSLTELSAGTPIGELDTAYLVSKFEGPEKPVIIYHHGNREKPFSPKKSDFSTYRNILLTAPDPIEATIIGVRAPYHTISTKAFAKKMTKLADFKLMICVTVVLIEKIIEAMKQSGYHQFLVSGISLGGWAANLHKSFYDSATSYVPLLAGAALGNIFITSSYRKTTSKNALENEQAIKEKLNFEYAMDKKSLENVHPLLAQYDRIIRYNRQKLSYRGNPVTVIDKGHVTAAMDAPALRKHVLSQL